MAKFDLMIEGKKESCHFSGTTSNGGLRLSTPTQQVILPKRMLDLWMRHPEINFQLETVRMRSGEMMTFLA